MRSPTGRVPVTSFCANCDADPRREFRTRLSTLQIPTRLQANDLTRLHRWPSRLQHEQRLLVTLTHLARISQDLPLLPLKCRAHSALRLSPPQLTLQTLSADDSSPMLRPLKSENAFLKAGPC